MASDEELRELIGRMSAAQRQGFHVPPAGIRIVLTALRFYLAARTWLAKPPDPREDAPRRKTQPYTGPLPTIGESRRLGLLAVSVTCAAPDCWHQRRITFDALGLPDEAVFVDIPRLRRFRCERCGSRQVRVSADWTDYAAQGNGRAANDSRPPIR